MVGLVLGHSYGQDVAAANAVPVASTKLPANLSFSPDQRAAVAAKSKPTFVSVDVSKLSGKEFLNELPTLETLARNGDMDTLRGLYRRLDSCANFSRLPDEEINHIEDQNYRQRRVVAKQILAQYLDGEVGHSMDEETLKHEHEKALEQAFDQRDLCTALTPRQIDSRLDWMRLGLEQHDRKTILDVTTFGTSVTRGVERVRNAEQLIELEEIEQVALDGLIEVGDRDALHAAIRAYGADFSGVLQQDSVLGYTYAFVASLASSAEGEDQQRNYLQQMESFANGYNFIAPLSPQQIADARAKGLLLFQRCCEKKPH
ncbi:hypothetical protein ELE36_18630 [Pseudolysobacter antarcticus]|uniref:Uncharacterized protein n=1 Tax=Pseudolysobacter antarcticus TaxID=2511995 RepID=A0A411HNY7_9GAMM|nr:hypothetical protein [Pseudolysobacter antarcticus]QBB72218.1 hypothetical protein ELE36_18630 [Pseudolysobacter antarcticus]